MKNNLDKKTIMDKVWAGKKLTPEEEMFYLTDILEIPLEEAQLIIGIQENKSDTVIVD